MTNEETNVKRSVSGGAAGVYSNSVLSHEHQREYVVGGALS
jgi:hypothetical protein